MKRVLFITYYWPPSGGGGVQRGVKFCKYLESFGWEPLILTVREGTQAQSDSSLYEDVQQLQVVERTKTLEPHVVFNLLKKRKTKSPDPLKFNQKQAKNARFIQTLGNYIRLNLFIPDSRIGWYPYAVQQARNLVNTYSPDAIFSTCPPYTPHLIAHTIKKQFNLPWIADFRDPWLENMQYNDVPRLKLVKKINLFLETRTLNEADQVLTVGSHLEDLLRSKLPERQQNKITLITNGYDEDDILPIQPADNPDVFLIAHYGTIHTNGFSPDIFRAIHLAAETDKDFRYSYRLKMVGSFPVEIRDAVLRWVPEDKIDSSNYIPHQAMLKELYQPQVLLLPINKVPHNELIITGKIFDYLPTGNPILSIGPEQSDAGRILHQTGAGRMFRYGSIQAMADHLIEQYKKWKMGELNQGLREYPKFTRKKLTEKLAGLMDQIA